MMIHSAGCGHGNRVRASAIHYCRTCGHASACQRWRLAISAFLLLGPCHGERTGVAHMVSGGLDPAVGTLNVRDTELVDMAVEVIGDAAQIPPDAKGIGI